MPEKISKDAAQLLLELEASEGQLSLRQRVRKLADLHLALRKTARRIILPDIRSARARILEYLRLHVGEVVGTDELNVVSGIHDSPRRIRELRIEHGWPIVSGLGHRAISADEHDADTLRDLGLPQSMTPSQYILLQDRRDAGAATRWAQANKIRRRRLSAKGKILEFFRANVGTAVTIEELAYVASGVKDWPRRTRELRTEDGWPIVTRFSGDPTMSSGTYMLAEDRQAEPHDRYIPELVRREVMSRDRGRCRWNGCGWPAGFPADDHRYLELHHINYHVKGGTNLPENLVTLCNLHHDELHRSGTTDFAPL